MGFDFKEILIEWGLNPISIVAGAIGGLISVVMNEKEFSFRRAAAQVLSALAFSGYGTDWFISWLGWEEKLSYIGMVGLFLGLCGIALAKGIMLIGAQFEKDPLSFIKTKKDDSSNS